MTDYKTIFGKKIKFLTTDLSNAEGEGEIFYSDSAKGFKVGVIGKAWVTTSVLTTARARSQGAGTPTAGLNIGGQDEPGTKLATTEEFNGTGWSGGGDMPAAKSDHAGDGTQTAAYAAGGAPYLNSAYTYDGSSWTGIPNIGTARQKLAGAGTTTAALIFAGQVLASPPQTNKTEEYSGSSWAEQNDMGTERVKLAGWNTNCWTRFWRI